MNQYRCAACGINYSSYEAKCPDCEHSCFSYELQSTEEESECK